MYLCREINVHSTARLTEQRHRESTHDVRSLVLN